MKFEPHWWLRSAHLQTLGASVLTRTPALAPATRLELLCADGVRLEAWHHPRNGARVVLIHGWLGNADANYMFATTHHLLQAGYDVVRLNLRDHGGTAHLNLEMFNSARLPEVVDACRQLADRPTALIGYSLGGNFAARVSAELELPALAICPAVDPRISCLAIDEGAAVYRLYFVRQWQRALAAKAQAFPEHYDFDASAQHRTVMGLTEHFIGNHLPFPSSTDYFRAYTLTPQWLQHAPVEIIAAEDDPVIPVATVQSLASAVPVQLTRYGGHCGYQPRAWLHSQLLDFLDRRL